MTDSTAKNIKKTINDDAKQQATKPGVKQIQKLKEDCAVSNCICGPSASSQNFNPNCPKHKKVAKVLNFSVVYRRDRINKG